LHLHVILQHKHQKSVSHWSFKTPDFWHQMSFQLSVHILMATEPQTNLLVSTVPVSKISITVPLSRTVEMMTGVLMCLPVISQENIFHQTKTKGMLS